MNESNVIKLLTIANNDLPAVEGRYELLRRKKRGIRRKNTEFDHDISGFK
jgi:hypothetical protein